jgi:hypothetical protein
VPNFSAWIFDLAGPGVLKRLKKMWGKKLKAADSEMHFAPVESDAFFRPYGWQTADFRELLQEGIRLHRHPPMLWVMKLYKVLAPRRFERLMKELRSGVVRLVRASA